MSLPEIPKPVKTLNLSFNINKTINNKTINNEKPIVDFSLSEFNISQLIKHEKLNINITSYSDQNIGLEKFYFSSSSSNITVTLDNIRFTQQSLPSIKNEQKTEIDNITFKRCTILNTSLVLLNTKELVFEDCKFVSDDNAFTKKNLFHPNILEIYSCSFDSPLIWGFWPQSAKPIPEMTSITINNTTFNKPVMLSSFNIKQISIGNSTFNDIVKFSENKISEDFILKNNTFNSQLILNQVSFGDTIDIATSSFRNDVFFNNISFCTKNYQVYDLYSFKDYFKQVMSSTDNAMQINSFRKNFCLIKNHYDKQKNSIDGNYFYALEVMAYEKFLTNQLNKKLQEADSNQNFLAKLKNYFTKTGIDFILLKLYKLTSDCGQNFFKAFGWWIINAIGCASLAQLGGYSNFFNIALVKKALVTALPPFHFLTNADCYKWSDYIFMPLGFVISTYLIWQMIVCSRRNIKR